MFTRANGVWIDGLSKEMNIQAAAVIFLEFNKGDAPVLRIGGSTFFRIFVNNEFVHHGPARAPLGYMRVDEVFLSSWIREGKNLILIEAAGYNCPCFNGVSTVSFIQAEVELNGRIVAATGLMDDHDHGSDNVRYFSLFRTERITKALRYSYQRHFSEVYRLQNPSGSDSYALNQKVNKPELIDPGLIQIARGLPLPEYRTVAFSKMSEQLQAEVLPGEPEFTERYIAGISDTIPGFSFSDIEDNPLYEVHKHRFINTVKDQKQLPVTLREGEYIMLDMGRNITGFIHSQFRALEDSDLVLVFDEKLVQGAIDPSGWETVNAVQYSVCKHENYYKHDTYECYGFRYLVYYAARGTIEVSESFIREFVGSEYHLPELQTKDEELLCIYKAAGESFRQNTLDLFMDCPTRERAGWLCDSYFTGQAAMLFSGNSRVEKVMLENYVLAETFPNIPLGMLPMCYPADHNEGMFIPQWALWYILELDGYFHRDPEADPGFYRDLCLNLFNWFDRYLNADGLLEKLPGWNFVEWSKANDWVQDVSYPTNMLYAKVLELYGGWFYEPEFQVKADGIRKQVIAQSWDGSLFRDHAVRSITGSLDICDDRSEVCQYYALRFGTVKPGDIIYEKLREFSLQVFGSRRRETKLLPEVELANALMGNYMRMELLYEWGAYELLENDIRKLFLHQARLTGTLWEHTEMQNSLNHGFSSYAGYLLYRICNG
jgi:alpha-L-rhamnosidase